MSEQTSIPSGLTMSSEQRLQALLDAQNPLLTKNFKMLMASSDYEYRYRLYYVSKEVLSVTNGSVLLRTPAPGVEDGLYDPTTPVSKSRYNMFGNNSLFPDVEKALPDMEKMRSLNPVFMARNVLNDFIRFCTDHYVQQLSITIDADRAYSSTTGLSFNFQFGLCERTNVLASSMVFALKEATRYEDGVFFAKEPNQRSPDGYHVTRAPLFIGRALSRCAIVAVPFI